MDINRLRLFFQRYLEQSATPDDEKELMQILADPAHEAAVKDIVENAWANWQPASLLVEERSEVLYAGIQQAIAARESNRPKRVVMFRWWRAAAAVIILVMLSGGAYLWLTHTPKTPLATAPASHQKNDLPPGGNKAILTLANGATILLDSAHNGVLTQQGNASIVKTDNGQLTYNSANEKSTKVLYNTLTTPRGGQYQLVLPDGSKVWLNAASSIHYPTAFTGKERKVEVMGEAYFEVVKNEDIPFIATANGMEVRVLGTHFNVNAYEDETTIRTTLLEGSVLVTKDAASAILKPGEQSRLAKSGKMNVLNKADVEEAVAWKNGSFSFKNADIETIMRQTARWYNIEVIYKAKIEDTYRVIVPRNVPVSQLFRFLELSGGVHFTIQGKKVIVTN